MPTVVAFIARALRARGVTHAFGMPGGATLPLIEALSQEGIEFVLVRHEGAAGFMADAAFHITRKPGVCVATLGPGATNLVSGVAGSLLERSKVVAISSQIATDIRDRYTHQILDHIALFRPVTKRAVHLSADAAPMQIMTALATLDRHAPGPVFFDIPTELNAHEVDEMDPRWGIPKAPRPVPDVSAAAALFAEAQRPVVLVGCGELSIPAANGVRRLIDAADAVSLTTYRAAGMVSDTHPLWAGTFGLSPVVDAHQQDILADADLMIAVGLDMVELRPNWLPGWPEDLPIISVDAFGQPDLLGHVTHTLTGPVMDTLDALRQAALGEDPGYDDIDPSTEPAVAEPGATPDRARRTAWSDARLAEHRAAWRAPFFDGPDGPAATIRAVQQGSPEGTRICLDVGAHRITAAHVLRADAPNQILQSNGFSSMGVALPSAITSRLVDPQTPCVAITGDAGLWMVLGELGIVQERRLDLVVVYLADAALSLIELKQQRAQLPSCGVRFDNPHVEHIARAFGGTGLSVRGSDQVRQVVEEAHQRGGLTIIEAAIDPQHYRHQM